MSDVKKLFALILKQERLMKKLSGTDNYYAQQEQVKKALATFIRYEDFGELAKTHLLKLCHMVYLYNPVANYTFLIRCERQYELLNKSKTPTNASK